MENVKNLKPGSNDEYEDLLKRAYSTVNQVNAKKPGAYEYGEDYGIANDYLKQYQSREPFSYDFNADALYNQYKDQHTQQGRMGMMDTMGQAAALTGGYGNSYAQTVGQQVYNQHLGQLNEIMPELYGMAYDRYEKEGQDLLNMYDLYMSKEDDNYSKYLDSVNLWNNELALAKDDYNTLYNEYIQSQGNDGGNGGGREVSSEDSDRHHKRFQGAKSSDDILFIANDLLAQGYSREYVSNLANYYESLLEPQQGPGSTMPTVLPYTGNSAGSTRSGGGTGPGLGGATGSWSKDKVVRHTR